MPNETSKTETNLTLEFATRLNVDLVHDEQSDVAQRARLLLIDGLAVAAGGASQPGPSKLARLSRDLGGNPQSAVIGHNFKTSAVQAARINGMSMHVLDYEPMWNPPNHASSTIIPAVLALAEMCEAQGQTSLGLRTLDAIVAGVEAQGRLRLASGQLEPKVLSLHPPGVVGPLAGAVACGRFLGLDDTQLAAAISIAASRASGILANVGSMTKALHCGDAAAHGLEAALLAMNGFNANADALNGPRGYGNSYYGDRFDADHLLAPLNTPRILDPGPAWKLFPSQYATHFAITAALDCHRDLPDGARIKHVRITTPVMPYIDRPRPVSGLDGKFSYQYCTAAALLDGRVGLSTFTDQRRFAPDVVELLDRTTLHQSADISGRFDEMTVEITVDLEDGRQVSHICDGPEGCWSKPLKPNLVLDKARDLISDSLPDGRDVRFWELLEQPLASWSIRELMAALM